MCTQSPPNRRRDLLWAARRPAGPARAHGPSVSFTHFYFYCQQQNFIFCFSTSQLKHKNTANKIQPPHLRPDQLREDAAVAGRCWRGDQRQSWPCPGPPGRKEEEAGVGDRTEPRTRMWAEASRSSCWWSSYAHEAHRAPSRTRHCRPGSGPAKGRAGTCPQVVRGGRPGAKARPKRVLLGGPADSEEGRASSASWCVFV